MINRLRRALVQYFMREYEDDALAAYNHTKDDIIGVAFTELCEELPDGTVKYEAHTMQVDLDMHNWAFIYKLDGNEIDRFTYASEEELADEMEDATFDGFDEVMHEHLPPEIY